MVAEFERQASGSREGFSGTSTAAGRQREQNLDDKTAEVLFRRSALCTAVCWQKECDLEP